jgi:DNA replication protein DnaC
MGISNMVKKRKGEMSLVSWIKNRIKKNENANIFTSGPTGSGKSYANLAIAYKLDPNFDPDTQIVFSFKELLRTIRLFNNDAKKEEQEVEVEIENED